MDLRFRCVGARLRESQGLKQVQNTKLVRVDEGSGRDGAERGDCVAIATRAHGRNKIIAKSVLF